MRTPLLTCIIALFSLLATSAHAQVPPDRLTALSRGVNIPHWWWLAQQNTPEYRSTYFTADEARRLRAAGLTHIRLPFDPDLIYDHAADKLKPAALTELKSTINMLTAAGLAVVLDAHPMGTGAAWALADKSPASWEAAFLTFWSTLAPALADTDPSRVFIEILNEPYDIKDKALWPRVQAEALARIRRACPNHTIILTGDDYGGIDGLFRLSPAPDKNVVYSFHFYESHTFTHQSATWGAPFWKHIKGLAYPVDPSNIEKVAASIADQQAAGAVRGYGKENWNAAKVATRIQAATDWARRHNATIYLGEFGALRDACPTSSRQAWLRDVVAAASASNVGWAMWDYAGGFALATGKPGERVVDPATSAALGLAEPKPPRP